MAAAMEPQDNRYAPPKALELELPPEAPPGPCPHVEWASRLIWIGFGFSVLFSFMLILTNHDARSRVPLWVNAILVLLIWLPIVYWITSKLRAGRNWMRLLISILNGLGVVILAVSLAVALSSEFGRGFLSGFFNAAPIPSASLVLHTVLGASEVILLNTPSARAWFAAQKFSA